MGDPYFVEAVFSYFCLVSFSKRINLTMIFRYLSFSFQVIKFVMVYICLDKGACLGSKRSEETVSGLIVFLEPYEVLGMGMVVY